MDLVGLVLGNSTQRRVDHPACARVLAMHRGVGGVLGPFTCGFRAGEDGERVGVSETGVAAAGKVSRAARWQRLSAEWHGCGWPVPAWRWRSGKRRVWQRHAWRRRCGSSRGRVIGGHDSGGCGIGGHDAVEQPSGCVAAAAVWQRQQCGIGGPVASAWQYQYGGGIAVARQQECDIISVQAAEAGPCGESGVAAAVWQQRQMAAAGRSRPGMINQGVARAFARVRRPGVLTFAAVSEVGVSGRRVDGGHSFSTFSFSLLS